MLDCWRVARRARGLRKRERRRMETKTEISLPAERCERNVEAKEGVRGDGGGS